MKVLLGSLATALVLLAAGCAGSSSDIADDPADPTSSPTATGTPTDDVPTPSPSEHPSGVEFQQVALLSQTAAGGDADPLAVRVDDEGARRSFLGQFENVGFAAEIEDAIVSATVPEGYALYVAVVAIGCDVPPGVNVTHGPDGLLIHGRKVVSPLPECFAPVTSVAVVAVPA